MFSINRCLWANYFEAQGIQYAFFSAANAVALQIARREASEAQLQKERSMNNVENEGGEEEEGGPVHSLPESPNTPHHTDNMLSNTLVRLSYFLSFHVRYRAQPI